MRIPADLYIPKVRFILFFGLLLSLALSSSVLFMGERKAAFWTDVSITASSFLSLLLCFFVLTLYRKHTLFKFWAGFFLNLLLWSLAEAVWAYYEIVRGIETPYPSYADALWLLGYIPLFYAFLKMKTLLERSENFFIACAIVFFVVASLFIVYYPKGRFLEGALTLVYVFFDLVFLSIITPLVLFYARRGFGVSWLLLLCSGVSFSLGDVLFAFYVAEGTYRAGTLPDFFYIFDYALLSLAFGIHLFAHKNYLAMEPALEKRGEEEKILLEGGTCVLLEDEKGDEGLKMFLDHTSSGMQGLCITRTYPELLKTSLGLEVTPMIWLSGVEKRGAVHPNDFSKILYLVGDFFSRSSVTIVFFDGLEYLMVQNGFKTTMKFLHSLRRLVVQNESRLIVSFNRDALGKEEYDFLKREMESTPS